MFAFLQLLYYYPANNPLMARILEMKYLWMTMQPVTQAVTGQQVRSGEAEREPDISDSLNKSHVCCDSTSCWSRMKW